MNNAEQIKPPHLTNSVWAIRPILGYFVNKKSLSQSTVCFQIISNIFQGNKKIASLITTTAECGDQSVCLGLDAGLLWSAIKETGLPINPSSEAPQRTLCRADYLDLNGIIVCAQLQISHFPPAARDGDWFAIHNVFAVHLFCQQMVLFDHWRSFDPQPHTELENTLFWGLFSVILCPCLWPGHPAETWTGQLHLLLPHQASPEDH